MASTIYTRTYTPSRSSQYKDQLNVWCDRLGFGHIRYITNLTDRRDERGHALYQSFPIFPTVIDLGRNYVAQGRSEQEAYHGSLSRIPWAQFPQLKADSIHYNFGQSRDGSVMAKPCLVMYGEYINMTEVVGFGTSQRQAEEQVATALVRSGHYCFYN